jgi:tetratricopeptide (TPR) repeat protein
VAKHGKRLTKKELKEDEVAEFFVDTTNYVRQHYRKVIGVAVVAVIAFLIVTVAMRQRRAAELEAQAWIARANLDLKMGSVNSALQSYQSIIGRYRGTWSHSDAVFFSASALFAVGRHDSAMIFFERYLNLGKRRPEFTVSAEIGVAQCLEELDRFLDAADRYRKVQREHPDSPHAPDALLGAARCLELSGDLETAEAIYQELIDLYPNSNSAATARMPLLEIRARQENT